MNRSPLSLVGGVAAGALLLSAAPALAASVAPTIVAGNPTCSDLGAATGHAWNELKVDPKSGTYTSSDGALTVTVTVSADTKSFSFTVANGELVDAAFAKGGSQGGNLYDYTPAGVNSDSGLVTPLTGGSGETATLSHMLFCYVPDKTPPTQPPVQPPAGGGSTPSGSPQSPGQPAQPATQGEVLGQSVQSPAAKPKKHKHVSKKVRKARAKVKAVHVHAVRTPRFTG